MIRRLLAALAMAACAAVVITAAERATFVLRNGDRVSGELTYKGGTVYTLNGRDYPADEVAVIEFVPGAPPVSELQQLPTSSQTAEHERDLFVMRDGSIVRGKLHQFAPDGSSVSFDPQGGSSAADRRTVPSSQVARVYVNARNARELFARRINRGGASPAATATTGAVPAGSIAVQGNQAWTDTGWIVRRGDRVSITATGTINFAQGGGDVTSTPDGNFDFTGPRNRYPVPSVPVGALIGRIDNNPAFAVGHGQTITMPASGRLFLGVNDDEFSDNSGAFNVVLQRQ